MTDQPVAITEMAIRYTLQAIVCLGVTAACAWFSRDVWLWAWRGAPGFFEAPLEMIALHGISAFIALMTLLKAANLLTLRVLPWAIARALHPGAPQINRRS